VDLAVDGAFAALPDDPGAWHPSALVLPSEKDLSRYLGERFAGPFYRACSPRCARVRAGGQAPSGRWPWTRSPTRS
jgi:hypothetical protein